MPTFHTVARAGVLGALLALPLGAQAEDAPPPPYLMTGANTVTIAVQWDAASLEGVIPDALTAVDDLSGGINVYYVEGGTGIAPYSSAYAYVNVQDPEGGTARHILGGWYGPDPKVAQAMQTHFAAPVEPGDSTQSAEGDSWTGQGGDGTGMIKIAITPSQDCAVGGGVLNYLAGDMSRLRIPFTGNFCTGEPLSVEISGTEGSTLSRIKVAKMLGGGQLKDGAFAFTK